jgi:hypothetical protein
MTSGSTHHCADHARTLRALALRRKVPAALAIARRARIHERREHA